MVIALFSLISWITVVLFFLIPKALDKKENIILFFCTTIIITSFYTVIDLNLKLVQHSYKSEMFLGLIIIRNIIFPLSLLIFINLYRTYNTRLARIILTLITLSILYFIELLTVWTGIKTYTGWNSYLTVITLISEIAFTIILTKWLSKLP